MAPSNKSKAYGRYGGVTKANHYVPPEVAPFVPQPASVQFTKEQLETLQPLLTSVEFTEQYLLEHYDTLMLRRLSGQDLDGNNVFEVYTLANPEDLIIYDVRAGQMRDDQNMDGGII